MEDNLYALSIKMDCFCAIEENIENINSKGDLARLVSGLYEEYKNSEKAQEAYAEYSKENTADFDGFWDEFWNGMIVPSMNALAGKMSSE